MLSGKLLVFVVVLGLSNHAKAWTLGNLFGTTTSPEMVGSKPLDSKPPQAQELDFIERAPVTALSTTQATPPEWLGTWGVTKDGYVHMYCEDANPLHVGISTLTGFTLASEGGCRLYISIVPWPYSDGDFIKYHFGRIVIKNEFTDAISAAKDFGVADAARSYISTNPSSRRFIAHVKIPAGSFVEVPLVYDNDGVKDPDQSNLMWGNTSNPPEFYHVSNSDQE